MAYAPVLVPVIFVLAGLLMVPLMVLIAVTGLVFGPFPGILYAFAGALASGAVTYEIGNRLGRNAIRKVAGRRLNEISQRLGKRGLVTVLQANIRNLAVVLNQIAKQKETP